MTKAPIICSLLGKAHWCSYEESQVLCHSSLPAFRHRTCFHFGMGKTVTSWLASNRTKPDRFLEQLSPGCSVLGSTQEVLGAWKPESFLGLVHICFDSALLVRELLGVTDSQMQAWCLLWENAPLESPNQISHLKYIMGNMIAMFSESCVSHRDLEANRAIVLFLFSLFQILELLICSLLGFT